MENRQCSECESVFVPNSGIQKTCSEKCCKERVNKRWRDRYQSDPEFRTRMKNRNRKAQIERQCLECDDKFHTSRAWQKTCSYKCSKDYKNKRQRDRSKNPEYRVRKNKRERERDHGYRKHWRFLCEAQEWRCAICGERLPKQSPDQIHVDHIIPVSRGGTDDLVNLQATHDSCNMAKGSRIVGLEGMPRAERMPPVTLFP